MAEIKIRLATKDDLPALVDVGDRLFDYPLKSTQAANFFADPGHLMAIANLHDDIIGFASAVIYVHPDKKPTLMINEVSVLSDYRNQGLATALVKLLRQQAIKRDCREVWVATEQSNTAARKAYLSAGGIEETESVVLVNFETKKSSSVK